MRQGMIALLLFIAALAPALDVAEEELRELGTRDVEFINYTGPYDTINTIAEIVGIGRSLGSGVDIGPVASDFELAGRYRIIRAVDPAVRERFDADIIVPLAGARVDHINNLRRIISGYLQEAYTYSAADADLLARWATIYNAVVRGNMEFFSDRYKPVVTNHLSPGDAGLSRRYDEWPGRSRIVIPLSTTAAPGVIGAVDPGEIADDRVIEELRTLDDRGIEDRREMIDLTERVIEEREEAVVREEEAIRREEERIAEEVERIVEEREEIVTEREEISTLPEEEREPSQEELEAREAELAERERRLEEERRAAEERREALLDDRQEIADLTDRVRLERERIARDARALLDEREISEEVRGLSGTLSPIHFLRVREEAGAILGQLIQINPVTGLLLNRSREDRIVSRNYTYHDNRLLVIVAVEDSGRLAHYDVTTLAETQRSEAEVHVASVMEVYGDSDGVYAVVRREGDWHLGRFDSDLTLVERSVIAVNPFTTMAFSGNKVWVQSADDRIVALALDDLRIAP